VVKAGDVVRVRVVEVDVARKRIVLSMRFGPTARGDGEERSRGRRTGETPPARLLRPHPRPRRRKIRRRELLDRRCWMPTGATEAARGYSGTALRDERSSRARRNQASQMARSPETMRSARHHCRRHPAECVNDSSWDLRGEPCLGLNGGLGPIWSCRPSIAPGGKEQNDGVRRIAVDRQRCPRRRSNRPASWPRTAASRRCPGFPRLTQSCGRWT